MAKAYVRSHPPDMEFQAWPYFRYDNSMTKETP